MDIQLIQLFVNGLAVGSIIALAAVGLTLTFGILRLPNFAHGDFMTAGAYLTLVANATGLDIWLSMAIGGLGTAGLMLLSEKLLWQPMRDRRATSTTLIIISIGLSFLLRNAVILIWGSENQTYRLPVMPALDFWGVKIIYSKVIVMILAVVAIATVHLILQRTKVGKAMRAVADDLDLARVSGIDVEWVVLCTWLLAGCSREWRRSLWPDYRRAANDGLVFDLAPVCQCNSRWHWQSLWGDRWRPDYWRGSGDEYPDDSF